LGRPRGERTSAARCSACSAPTPLSATKDEDGPANPAWPLRLQAGLMGFIACSLFAQRRCAARLGAESLNWMEAGDR
jgi:hypothetical protein